jgi:hypothetical protein
VHGGLDDVGAITRRTLVRTTARSAWAAPLVVAATAAPAYAAGSAQAQMSVTMSEPVRAFGNVPVAAVLRNIGTVATDDLTVVLDFVPAFSNSNFSTSTSTTPAGFAAPIRTAPPSGLYDAPAARFTYVALAQLPANAALNFEVVLMINPTQSSGLVYLEADPGTGASGTAQADFS